jgi:hypothetical protein
MRKFWNKLWSLLNSGLENVAPIGTNLVAGTVSLTDAYASGCRALEDVSADLRIKEEV